MDVRGWRILRNLDIQTLAACTSVASRAKVGIVKDEGEAKSGGISGKRDGRGRPMVCRLRVLFFQAFDDLLESLKRLCAVQKLAVDEEPRCARDPQFRTQCGLRIHFLGGRHIFR